MRKIIFYLIIIISLLSCDRYSLLDENQWKELKANDSEDDQEQKINFVSSMIGSDDLDMSSDIVIDSNNNIYIAGWTYGDFDTWSYGNITKDIVIAKYNSGGTKLFSIQMNETGDETVSGITVDDSNRIWFCGSDSNNFHTWTSFGQQDIIVFAIASDGTLDTAAQIGSTLDDEATCIGFNKIAGQIFAAGITKGDFGGNTNNGFYDAFVMNYTMSWVKYIGDTSSAANNDVAASICFDDTGYVYVAGNTYGNIDNSGTNISPPGIFISKFSSSLTENYTKLIATGNNTANDMIYGTDGFIYITGTNGTDITIFKINPGDGTIAASGTLNIDSSFIDSGLSITQDNSFIYIAGKTFYQNAGVVVKYDKNNLTSNIWQQLINDNINSSMIDYASGIALGPNGYLYITGRTYSNLYGAHQGGGDFFLTRMNR